MKYLYVTTLLASLLFTPTVDSFNQCSMCKSTVESNQKENQERARNKAQGLNNGILYLMTVPYILIGAVGYFWYINSKKETRAKKDRKNY